MHSSAVSLGGPGKEVSGWAVGLILFAGLMMIMAGIFPYYPFWSLTLIALDIFFIWALAAHGRDVATDRH